MNPPRSSAAQLKDQRMLKKILAVPALAGCCLVASTVCRATTISEPFVADPLAHGWLATGDTGLFHWNAANRELEVTWDSSRTNSYFCRPIGMNLTQAADFMLGFDLRLGDIGPGADTNKPFTFQIAIGLLNLAQATSPGFIRGTGSDAPNLVEFDYFWDSGFGATVSPVLISSNNEFSAGGFTFPLELRTNVLYHVTMLYLAEERTLRTALSSNGVPCGPVKDATLGASFSDFSVDHFGVSSYSDAGQFPGFEGSVLAHGVVDNFMLAVPPPVTKLKAVNEVAAASAEFVATTNWLYLLERTTNFQTWSAASATLPGVSGTMRLQDTNPPAASAFYRIRAEFP